MTGRAPVQHGLAAPSQSIIYHAEQVVAPSLVPEPAPVEPVYGAAIVFQQTNSLTDHLNNVAGSGLLPGGQTENMMLVEGGTPGSVDLFFVVNTEAIRAHVFMETALNEPNEPLWQAGTWTMRFNVRGTVGNNARIRTCGIYRVDSVGVNKGLVAGTSDLNIACSFGLKTWSMSGVESNGLATDRIQVVIGLNRTVGSVTVRIRPNQEVNTPILRAA